MEHARHLINEMLHRKRERANVMYQEVKRPERCNTFLATQTVLKMIPQSGEISRQEIIKRTSFTDLEIKAAVNALMRSGRIHFRRNGVNSFYRLAPV
jgi:transcription initiation factor IIE alpha subunit